MNFSKEQRNVIFQQLPKDVAEVFMADETTQTIKRVGQEHDLSKEERGELGEAVGLVLLGILSVKEFQERLYERIDGPKSAVNKIVKGLQQKVFQPISGQLEKLDAEALLKKEANSGGDAANMPVPPPPGGAGGPPAPSYGGTSDPYREPTDN
jgi:hypothetical protein